MASITVYKELGNYFNSLVSKYNFQVSPRELNGKNGSNIKTMREYRLQLVVKTRDTSKEVLKVLETSLNKDKTVSRIKFNSISPNSSKFPSYSFYKEGVFVDLIIAKGANSGEVFETKTVADLRKFFTVRNDDALALLIEKMNKANDKFASTEIKKVEQRKGATKKEGVPIAQLGRIIGDIVLTDTLNEHWYISLKNINGNTFSSYSGAASLFDTQGNLQPNSVGAVFLRSFGVDLNKVQSGFDERNNIRTMREHFATPDSNNAELKAIFERAWGMNYFYVRKQIDGWKVFWLDEKKLNKFTTSIRVTNVKYPGPNSKQISIFCENSEQKYLIEIRNSKKGEYPNDIKFKVIP